MVMAYAVGGQSRGLPWSLETWELSKEGHYVTILMCWLRKALEFWCVLESGKFVYIPRVCGKGKLPQMRSLKIVVRRRTVAYTTTLCEDGQDNYNWTFVMWPTSFIPTYVFQSLIVEEELHLISRGGRALAKSIETTCNEKHGPIYSL